MQLRKKCGLFLLLLPCIQGDTHVPMNMQFGNKITYLLSTYLHFRFCLVIASGKNLAGRAEELSIIYIHTPY